MIRSMTGFGSSSGEFAGRTVTVELKSVNNRFREVLVRAPKVCAPLEEIIKKTVAGKLERGRVDLWIQLDDRELKQRSLSVNVELASEIKRLLEQLRETLQIDAPVTLDQILSHGIISFNEESHDLDELWRGLEPCLNEAIDALISMREVEGAALLQDLEKRLAALSLYRGQVETLSAGTPHLLMEKLKTRLSELTANMKFDPMRLAQEAAMLADKADITEEIVRLASHIERFHEFLDGNEPSGRRLDFLLQEMGREVNTMGSKAQDARISSLVLSMKAELEKMREQAQNVE